jgi:sec-independent protein translocase protein TatC
MTDYPEGDREQTFLEHLVELRSRLIKACFAILIVLVCLLPFARKLYNLLATPMLAQLPEGSTMIAIDVASPFLAPFKLALLLSLIISIPIVLYQLWAFVAPALFRHEKRLARPLLFSSVLLFYLGCAFAYFVVFPLVFGFMTRVAPEGVAVMTDISRYLDFVITLFLAFGITFEVPIATIILVATGITSTERLASARPYVIVGAFAIGMLLTPPDVISQTLLALPMWVLFEVGILFSRILLTGKEPENETDQATS